ncbi:thioredoxin-dependent thiol peroxidase [Nemorincola caseinilytica]|uniref:thioredoxin-dependent peroxiredoxin n=1 Tax=Nemorincola caseinilytica TaxID=2054315 RepID=A0ABP8N994_9BACT
MLQQGDKAPAFRAVDQDGKLHTLKDYKGQKIAIYFYPQDDTETCTKQACNLRDNIGALRDKGIVVLGVSPDTEKSHKKFETKFSLPFTLLVDTDLKMAKAFGVWAWKKFMGREYWGILRTTFLINEKGRIDHVIERVISKTHAQQIIEKWGL